MYEGTLYCHWEAIVTLQQMLVLCNSEGVIDMTPQAISARTSIPLDIITKGIVILSEPDPYTRAPGEDGRRIVLMDDRRPWGWLIVNYLKYRDLKSRQDKLDADRIRVANKRKMLKNNHVAECRTESQHVADVAHATTTTTTTKAKTLASAEESAPASASVVVVAKIPIAKGDEFSITSNYLAELESAYPKVDGLQTLKEIRAWCVSNPTECWTARGVMRGINRWFEREQNKFRRS